MKTILETERLTLREFTPSDVDDLSLVLCDRENMRFYPNPFERSHVERWIEWSRDLYQRDGFRLWAMRLKDEHQVIGDCGLILQDVDGLTEVEIGYHLRRDRQGRGLATEAARACCDFALGSLGEANRDLAHPARERSVTPSGPAKRNDHRKRDAV